MATHSSGIKFTVGTPPPMERLPLRVMIAADFSGGEGRRATTPFVVSRESFKEILAEREPGQTMEVHNHLSRKPATRFFRISVQDLKDFTPAALAVRVPELNLVRELVEQMEALRKKKTGPAEVRTALDRCAEMDALAEPMRLCREALEGKASPAAAGSRSAASAAAAQDDADDSVARILGMVDAPKAADPKQEDKRVKSAVGSLIGKVTGSSGRSGAVDGSPLGRAAAMARGLLADQLYAIMHHPQFQSLESTWRGLKALVDRTNFRKGATIELLDTSREGLEDALARTARTELDGISEVALSVIGLDFAFDNSTRDLELLGRLAEQAEQLQVPLLTSVGHRFFGLDEAPEASRLPYMGRFMEQQQYIKWNSLRQKDCSRWLAVAFNRFLLREPYGEKDRDAGALAEDVCRVDQLLWGSPVWAVAALVTGSHVRTGWPTEITGMDDGCIEDLPIHEVAGDGARTVRIPLESYIPDKLSRDLAEVGFITLSSPPEGDCAYLFRAPILHRPPHYSREDTTEQSRVMASLSYQMLASRVADMVYRSNAALAGGATADEVKGTLQALLLVLIADTGPQAGVGVTLRQEGGQLLADLHLRTGAVVMNSVELNFTIRI